MKNSQDGATSYVRLNEQVLRRGDIILVTQASKNSRVIRATTFSDVSHAMVYIEDRSVIDARPHDGVHSSNTQRLFLDGKLPVYALRLKKPPTQEQLTIIELDLRSKVGTRYSEEQARSTIMPRKPKINRQQFCSRLVAQAFEAAGISLVRNANFCSPGDVKRSKQLEEVDDPVVPVTAEWQAFFEDRADIPELMQAATNALLDGARRYDPNIEDLSDLNQFVADNPGADGAICDLLTTSGYLDIWQIEKLKNPWQYDLALMNAESQEGMEAYCRSALDNDDDRFDRFVHNRKLYAEFTLVRPRQFFGMMYTLWHTLLDLNRQRMNVARQWLDANQNA